MAQAIEEWPLPNDGFKFRGNPPDGCGDMGVGVGGLGGEYFEWICGICDLRPTTIQKCSQKHFCIGARYKSVFVPIQKCFCNQAPKWIQVTSTTPFLNGDKFWPAALLTSQDTPRRVTSSEPAILRSAD